MFKELHLQINCYVKLAVHKFHTENNAPIKHLKNVCFQVEICTLFQHNNIFSHQLPRQQFPLAGNICLSHDMNVASPNCSMLLTLVMKHGSYHSDDHCHVAEADEQMTTSWQGMMGNVLVLMGFCS